MLVMTYSEARQNFATILNKSYIDGAVLVKRADGRLFKITPEESRKSPFEGVKTIANIKSSIILDVLKETREEN